MSRSIFKLALCLSLVSGLSACGGGGEVTVSAPTPTAAALYGPNGERFEFSAATVSADGSAFFSVTAGGQALRDNVSQQELQAAHDLHDDLHGARSIIDYGLPFEQQQSLEAPQNRSSTGPWVYVSAVHEASGGGSVHRAVPSTQIRLADGSTIYSVPAVNMVSNRQGIAQSRPFELRAYVVMGEPAALYAVPVPLDR